MWFFLLALKQLRARWQSLLTIIVGALLAAIIGANASLYTEAIASVGLLEHLSVQRSADTHMLVRGSFTPENPENVTNQQDRLTSIVTEMTSNSFDANPWTPTIYAGAETQAMFALRDGNDMPNVSLRLAHYTDIQQFVTIEAGTFPNADTDTTTAIPVAIHADAASQLGLTIGDQLNIDQRGWDTSQIFTVEIVGLIRETDPTAPYWLEDSPLRRDIGSDYRTNLLTTETAFQQVTGVFIPQPIVQLNWRLLFPHVRFPVARLNTISEQVSSLEPVLADEAEVVLNDRSAFVVATDLPNVLASYGSSIDLLNIPTSLILLQLGALVLFFLVVIAALVRRGERREIALLQSRGGADKHIFILQGIETLIICTLTALIAPFLARAILLVLLPLFTGITGVTLVLDSTEFLYAGLVSLVAFVILLWTVRPVLRQPLITGGGVAARSHKQTWWQRYYIDVVLLVVGIIALTQFSQDRILTTAVDGTVRADPLLLLSPTLLFIAVSSIMLRFVPLIMNALSQLAMRRTGLVSVLATWQVSREPLHYGRITFLLALAIGIGGFAVTYQSTIRGNERDRALYAVGSEARLVFSDESTHEQRVDLINTMDDIPDIDDTSINTRIALVNINSGSAGASGRSSGGRSRNRQTGVLLAVNSETIIDVAYERPDLGTLTPPQLEDVTLPEIGQVIPAGTQTITLQAHVAAQLYVNFNNYTDAFIPSPEILRQAVTITARFRDADGGIITRMFIPDSEALDAMLAVYQEAFLEAQAEREERGIETTDQIVPADVAYPDSGWITLTATLSANNAPLSTEDLTLDALLIDTNGFVNFTGAQLTFADIRADDTLLSMYDTEDWAPLNVLFDPTAFVTSDFTPDDYEGESFTFGWFSDDNTSFGLFYNYPAITTVTPQVVNGNQLDEENIVGIPVYISRSLAESAELVVGQRFSLLVGRVTPWFEVIDIIDYYPTLYQDEPYLVADQDLLSYTLARSPLTDVLTGEIWIQTSPTVDVRAIPVIRDGINSGVITDVRTVNEQLQTYRSDTLALGIIGLLYFSFVIGMILSAVSLFTYVSLSIKDRLTEFAVLRAMGLPDSRVLLLIVLEQVLILVTALILGAIIGYLLTTQVLLALMLSAAGGNVTPPNIIRFDVGATLLYSLVIILVMILILAVSTVRVRRDSGAQALRF
ncbi:MAG: ABC transporter permease [Chloroflexota bacterium]